MSLTAFIPLLGSVIDKIFPDATSATQAKTQLLELYQRGELKHLDAQVAIITAEAQGDSWLQRSWRPILMLTFTGLVASRWLGLADPSLTPELELELFEIVKLGIGGYVVGRSVEKTAKELKTVPYFQQKYLQ